MKKSFMTRMLAVSLSAAMTFSLSSASSLTATEAAAKKLPANNKAVSISLKVGNSKVLKLKNYKAWNIKKGATNKKAVAAVANKGTAAKRTIKVTAKKQGTAKVTLTLGKRKTADSKTTKYSKTIKKVVTVKVKAADTSTDTTTPTDTTPTDTTPTTPSTTTGSATNVTPGVLHIAQAKATHADVIAVSFSSIVTSTSAVKVTVTRGTTPIDIKKQSWDAGATGLTLEMVSKLTKGTYTITATDGKDTTTATVEVTDNEVVEKIVFKGEQALTGRAKNSDSVGTYAYVYFDVLNQYGDSIKETVSIQWTASATIDNVDRARGRITLKKSRNASGSSSSKEVFTYGDKIYVTGVYTKTGIAESGTFSVGTEQAVDKIEFKGFIKKGDSNIVQTLPSDFKANEYQLLYEAVDQNGNPMAAEDYLYDETADDGRAKQLTFISDNVLVLKDVLHNDDKSVTVNGYDYCAANVVPGINVTAGGDLHLTAIATRTGTKSEFSVVVGKYKILHKFEMKLPDTIVADGESVEIPFVAEDADGNKITNFKELATQSNFSKLTFNESDGYLVLEECKSGDARLVWYDAKMEYSSASMAELYPEALYPEYYLNGKMVYSDEDLHAGDKFYLNGTSDAKWNTSSANGIERPISLTSIVVGGETSNLLLQVSDKARPESISNVDMNTVMVDESDQNISYGHMEFVDQYSRNMKNVYDTSRKNDLWIYQYDGLGLQVDWDGKYVYDNGFFAATYDKRVGGNDDVRNHVYGVKVSMHNYNGNDADDDNDYVYHYSDKWYQRDLSKQPDLWATNGGNQGVAVLYGPAVPTDYEDGVSYDIDDEPRLGFTTKETDGKTPEVTLKFAIVRLPADSDEQLQEISKKFTKSLKIVPIQQLTNYRIEPLNKFSITTSLTDYDNGEGYLLQNPKNVIGTSGSALDGSLNATLEQDSSLALNTRRNVKVLATYAGTEIEIPAAHYWIKKGGILETKTGNLGDKEIAVVNPAKIKYSDLYNTSTARLDRKDATDTIIAEVFTHYYDEAPQATVKTTVQISDDKPYFNTFEATDTMELKPSGTNISLRECALYELADQSKNNEYVIRDQFNDKIVLFNSTKAYSKAYESDGYYDPYNSNTPATTPLYFEYNVKDVVENTNGFVLGNFKISDNASQNTKITGAEPGDTFTLEITVFAQEKNVLDGLVSADSKLYKLDDTNVTHVVKVTVGADQKCFIHDSDNWYSDDKGDKDDDGNIIKPKTVRESLQYQLNQLLGTEGTTKN